MKKIIMRCFVAVVILVSMFLIVAVSATRYDGPFMDAPTTPATEETEITVATEPELIDPEPTEVVEETTEPTEPPFLLDEAFEAEWGEAAVYMAKTLWGEARGTSADGQEMVGWCILNRVDDPRFHNTIIGVITAPNQFHGYSPNFPCTDEFYQMSLDIIYRWQLEKRGGESNRILDPDYLYFCADASGLGNVFRKSW